MPTITVLHAEYAQPINSQHGFYVQVRIDTDRLTPAAVGEALMVAEQAAVANGWRPLRGLTGSPVAHGAYYTLATWFYGRI